jgi:N-acetyltransferase
MTHGPMQFTHAPGWAALPVRLSPLAEADRAALRASASDPAIWRWWPRDVPGDGWDRTFDWQLAEQAAGRWLIHTVRLPTGETIGQTCYLNLRPEHCGLEIGGTWYAPGIQGSSVNPACKLALLDHAFVCGAVRVELKTDARNARSRAAMLKFGASFEGIHRQHLKLPDGSWRDTAWYSVLDHEWPSVRQGLLARLGLLAAS